MSNTPTPETWEDPFETFIERTVNFDQNGRSELNSFHGLTKLLKRFWKEVVIQEIESARREEREETVKQNLKTENCLNCLCSPLVSKPTPTVQEEWEKIFDKRFSDLSWQDLPMRKQITDVLKDFISKTISEALTKEREKIKKKFEEEFTYRDSMGTIWVEEQGYEDTGGIKELFIQPDTK